MYVDYSERISYLTLFVDNFEIYSADSENSEISGRNSKFGLQDPFYSIYMFL